MNYDSIKKLAVCSTILISTLLSGCNDSKSTTLTEQTKGKKLVESTIQNNKEVIQATQTKNEPKNFLIGICKIISSNKGTPLTRCDTNSARKIDDTHVIQYFVFNESDLTINVIFTAYGRKIGIDNEDIKITIPIQYTVEGNSVITKVTPPNNCISITKYTKEGDSIYEESIDQSGNFGVDQKTAFNNSMKVGTKKVKYLQSQN